MLRRARLLAVFAVISATTLSACTSAPVVPGVTEEPCPAAVDDAKGCIYLGVLSDLTDGPFAPVSSSINEGLTAFWDRVNASGGIGDRYEVDVTTYTRDNHYDAATQIREYAEIEPHILAVASSLGTPPTLAALPFFDADDMVAVPASWWSGWSSPDIDSNLILESGTPYCLESMNALDWYSETFSAPASVMAVHFPGEYGGDSAAGVRLWAAANDIEFDESIHDVTTGPNDIVGNQDAAVALIVAADPDVVILATQPIETAAIVAKAAASGYLGRFIGSLPSFNPVLLTSEAATTLQAQYHLMSPWGPMTADTAGHRAMRAAAPDATDSDAFAQGWVLSYPLRSLLEATLADGELSRAALRAHVNGLVVDYEGIAPPHTVRAAANANVARTSVVLRPDETEATGVAVVADAFVGPTAATYVFTQPCHSPVAPGS